MCKRFLVLGGACLACLTTTPGLAVALAGPVADCQAHSGQLTQPWTAAQLRSALATMPADIREYSDCYDVIQKALLGDIHGLNGGASGNGGGSFLPIWLIVVLALLVLGGASLGLVALRNRDRPPPAE